MSTGGNFILTESVKYSLCSDIIMTFLVKNHNNAVYADNVQHTRFKLQRIFILGQIYF